MIIEYEREREPIFIEIDGISEWDGDIVETTTFEPSTKQLKEALVDVIVDAYFEKLKIEDRVKLRVGIQNLLDDLDLNDVNIKALYYDELKAIFEDEAWGDYGG